MKNIKNVSQIKVGLHCLVDNSHSNKMSLECFLLSAGSTNMKI